MPTYEFQCSKCKTPFDVTRPMSKAGDPAKCPKCKAKAKRIFGAAIVGVGSDFDMGGFDMPDMGDMGDMGGMPDMGGMGMPGMGGMPGMSHGHDHGLPMDDDFGF